MGSRHERLCASCDEPTSKRCSGCRKVWYCSKSCQRSGFYAHIFECSNPGREITTADHLYLAVIRDRFPEDPQTLCDYGFERAFTVGGRSKLLGLYQGMMLPDNDMKPSKLHRWRLFGTLTQEIKNFYLKIPGGHRGGYFPWFLRNQWIIDTSLPPPHIDYKARMDRATWSFVGGRSSLSADEISAAILAFPEERRSSFHLYQLLPHDWHPSPSMPMWINFGFCVCHDEYEEAELGKLYHALITHPGVAFDDFCDAFSSSGLIALLDAHGFRDSRNCFADLEDVLRWSLRSFKSVWYLKSYALGDDLEFPTRSVIADYGFMNCRTDTERTELKNIYAEVFKGHDSQPLLLHQACIEGRLFEHVGGLAKLKKKFKRLMKNAYPLEALTESLQ